MISEKTATANGSTALFKGLGKRAVKKEQPNKSSQPDEVTPVEDSVPNTGNNAANFVYMEDLRKALSLAFMVGENIILFGKGGHAKSEYTEYFFEERGIEPFVKTMGSGTTTDSLFGGIDIKTFNETGKLEYLVENSFMNHEYVVFEEIMIVFN